jgi:DegV family protein with EDD domain
MPVKIVTDSTSDIPPELAQEFGITVVPVYIRFNDTVYRDRVDITPQEFFKKLPSCTCPPASSQPTPEDFEKVYNNTGDDTDGIVSIHISSKVSGTYNSANIAKTNMLSRCPIEVVDSGLNSAGLALVVMAAVRAAQDGKNISGVLSEAKKAIRETSMFGVVETTEYLTRSGRVSKSICTASRYLNVLPLLTFREGEIVRAGLVRSLSKGLDRAFRYVDEKKEIQELNIVHGNAPERAQQFRKRLAWLFPEDSIQVLDMGAALGVHLGPGVIIVGVREEG